MQNENHLENHLMLYVDVEFIVGAIGTGYGVPHLIKIEEEALQWLYFFNDPYLNSVSFGKKYKKHYLDGELNYYGKFMEGIADNNTKFSLRHVPYPLVEMLDVSKMLDLWKAEYYQVTQTNPDAIPTLVTFSSSISDLSKQNFVDYLKRKGFDIKSYTIPLAELALKKLLIDKKIKAGNEKPTLMLEATNSTLHFTKLVYHDEYFLKDGDVKSLPGRGIDPRKRALCNFLVGELNSATGLLKSEDEKEAEIERFEPQSAEWLKEIDKQTGHRPISIKSLSFKIAKHLKRDILVYKENLEADTGRFVQYLTDEYSAFKSEFCPNGIQYCCFVGNCFLSERIKTKFENILGKENTFFFKTTNITDIISVYPLIDLQRYADEENRIKEKAAIAAKKLQEEREAQEKREKEKLEAEEAGKRIAEEKKRKEEAQSAYQRSLDLDKQGKLEDAKANIDNAIDLAPEDLTYRKFSDYLTEKLKKQREKLLSYKTFLKEGDQYFTKGQYDMALEKYKNAQKVDENAEIQRKIFDCETKIAKALENKKKINSLLIEIDSALNARNVQLVEVKIRELLKLDPTNEAAIEYGKRNEKIKKEKTAEEKVAEAKSLYEQGEYETALNIYKEALSLNTLNRDAKNGITNCKEIIQRRELKGQIDILGSDFQKALQKKDIETAKKICEQLLEVDSDNKSHWKTELDRCAQLLKLSSPRYVREELAGIKGILRKGNLEKAKEQLELLEKNLHIMGNTSFDSEIAELHKDITELQNINKLPPHPTPTPQKGGSTNTSNKKDETKTTNDNNGKKDKTNPIGGSSQAGFARTTTLTEKEIKQTTRDIKALISTKNTAKAEKTLFELKTKLTEADFDKYGLNALVNKLKEL